MKEMGLLRHLDIPVKIVCGFGPPISLRNSLNTQVKLFVVSFRIRTPPKIVVWKWLLTPTNKPKGIL
jgi:hypothetical protein